ncbi:MAG TPA: PqiC family protein [Cellvibrio sp.]|nr:PqiC family protein [Cellvibrio sp.]
MRRILLLAFSCSLFLSCQHSPQKNFYYLTAQLVQEPNQAQSSPTTPEKSTAQTESSKINQLIGIGPIEVADYLNRSQIIENQSNNSLNMADNAFWAEPLDKSIARVTALNLTQVNSARNFVYFPWRSDSKPRYSIRVRIDELSRTGNQAKLSANWELMDNDTKTNLLRKNFTRSTPVDSGAKALAQTYSKLLADLAGEMDAELNKIPQ